MIAANPDEAQLQVIKATTADIEATKFWVLYISIGTNKTQTAALRAVGRTRTRKRGMYGVSSRGSRGIACEFFQSLICFFHGHPYLRAASVQE